MERASPRAAARTHHHLRSLQHVRRALPARSQRHAGALVERQRDGRHDEEAARQQRALARRALPHPSSSSARRPDDVCSPKGPWQCCRLWRLWLCTPTFTWQPPRDGFAGAVQSSCSTHRQARTWHAQPTLAEPCVRPAGGCARTRSRRAAPRCETRHCCRPPCRPAPPPFRPSLAARHHGAVAHRPRPLRRERHHPEVRRPWRAAGRPHGCPRASRHITCPPTHTRSLAAGPLPARCRLHTAHCTQGPRGREEVLPRVPGGLHVDAAVRQGQAGGAVWAGGGGG